MYTKLLDILRRFFGVDKNSEISEFVKKQEDILNHLFDVTGIDVNPNRFIADYYPQVLLSPRFKNESDEIIKLMVATNLFEFLQRIEYEPMSPYTPYRRVYLIYEELNNFAGRVFDDREVKDFALLWVMGMTGLDVLEFFDNKLLYKGVQPKWYY